MTQNNDNSEYVTCTICEGKGCVEVVNEQGVVEELQCPICKGYGKIKRRNREYEVRYFRRTTFLRKYHLPYPGSRGGGRTQREINIKIPLSVYPYESDDDGSNNGKGTNQQFPIGSAGIEQIEPSISLDRLMEPEGIYGEIIELQQEEVRNETEKSEE